MHQPRPLAHLLLLLPDVEQLLRSPSPSAGRGHSCAGAQPRQAGPPHGDGACHPRGSTTARGRAPWPASPLSRASRCPRTRHLELLKQALHDVQQEVPRHRLELPPVLLDESGYGEHDFVGHHLVWTGHGLEQETQGTQRSGASRSCPASPHPTALRTQHKRPLRDLLPTRLSGHRRSISVARECSFYPGCRGLDSADHSPPILRRWLTSLAGAGRYPHKPSSNTTLSATREVGCSGRNQWLRRRCGPRARRSSSGRRVRLTERRAHGVRTCTARALAAALHGHRSSFLGLAREQGQDERTTR